MNFAEEKLTDTYIDKEEEIIKGAEDWHEAQEGNVRIYLQNILSWFWSLFMSLGIEDLHKALHE